MLQRLAGRSGESEELRVRGSPPMGGPPPGRPPEGGAEMLAAKVGVFAVTAGLDEETVTSLQDQLDSAIIDALGGAEASADHRKLVDEAILNTLEEYGLDGEAFLNELEASRPAGGPVPSGSGGDLPQSDVMAQMFSLMNGDASSLSTNMRLLDALA